MATGERIKSAIRNINVMNVALLVVVTAFAAYVFPPLLNIKVRYTLPIPKKTVEVKEENPAAPQSPSAMDYTVIAEQNVFNPDRKIPPEKKEEQPVPKPEFVLYGTLITNDTSMAFIDDLKAPYSTSGRGQRQRTLRIGSSLSGYTLKEVHPDSVLMVSGEDRMELKVIDASKAKKRETAGPASGAVAGQTPHAAGSAQGPGAASSQQLRGTAPAISRASRAVMRSQQQQQNLQGQQPARDPRE